MSSETLTALAGALNVSLDVLRHDERDLFAKLLREQRHGGFATRG